MKVLEKKEVTPEEWNSSKDKFREELLTDRRNRFFCILDLELQRRPMIEGQRFNPGWRFYRRGKKRRIFIGEALAGPPKLEQAEALPRQAVARNGHGNFGAARTERNV